MGKVIVVEDNTIYCGFVCNRLEKAGIRTEKASSLAGARHLVSSAGADDIVLADLRLPDGDSIRLLRWMRENGMGQPFVMMTDYAEVHTAVETMKLGAEDYIPKRLLEDKLLPVIRQLQERRKPSPSSGRMIYERDSGEFRKVWKYVNLVAPTDISVLVLGENGTGKEHVAERIHRQSGRADKPFVAVDCGVLSQELAQSAFFGHVKGAFTGADKNRDGYFREADGGTLFLDEIGNLPMAAQQMLLRVIQEKRYRPVGAGQDRSADVRIIAATNEDLSIAVAEKRFRQDLFYRLRDFVISVPPLRDCREDILPLAMFFLKGSNRKLSRNVTGFDAAARKALLAYTWPGNVRELQQVVQSAVLLTENGPVTVEILGLDGRQSASETTSLALKDEKTEKERIRKALEQTGGNHRAAAELLKISHSTLYRKLKQYKMF